MLIPLLGAAPGEIPEVITDKETRDWLASARLATEPYLVPLGGAGRRASDFPRCATTDLKDDVLECQRRLEERGLELLVLDQTRDEIGLPVVKVIVPGLRHFWARFGPGRLYDVPAQLGWVARPLDETELNPVPMFI
jgi:ribosomal protein S12 methylthiotransferase accessory factor